MEPIYGIDLGTTNSCIATIGEDGLPTVIKNLEGKNTTPSVVFYEDEDGVFVGEEAKYSMNGEPERSVAFIKREMSKPGYTRDIDGQIVTPVDASALILKKVFDDANQQLSEDGKDPIKKAVVTVPAYFGNMERELTKQAAQIAGIEILDLLNEPTAAALNYGTKGLEGKTFMIYDLGGGTFDVSIMRMKNGVLDTLSTDGDHQLGGIDWDISLLDYALLTCGLDITYNDIKDERDAGKMLNDVEQCKKRLSKNDKAMFKFVYKRKQYTCEVSRSLFEEITADLLNKTINIVNHAINISRDPSANIDEIILVGGSSYMPMVKEKLKKIFSCPIRLDNLEPDLAVAKGAALHASRLAGDKTTSVEIGNDMGSRSYGILCIDSNDKNKFFVSNIILRTDDLIHDSKHTFETAFDGQTSVNISIYENKMTEKYVNPDLCTLVRSGDINWGYGVPAHTTVSVVVSRSSDSTVKIWCECQGVKIDFELDYKGMYSDEEIEKKRKLLATKIV